MPLGSACAHNPERRCDRGCNQTLYWGRSPRMLFYAASYFAGYGSGRPPARSAYSLR